MVSFFRKKKRSAEAKKDGKDASQQSSPAVGAQANADASSAPSTEPPPVPARAVGPPPSAAASNKRSASLPSKRRSFLSGGGRGSRSSVSRLPAVQEEIAHQNVGTPDNHEDGKGETMNTESTPPTVPVSTPDLLGSLSYDDQQEGEVEILTPAAKDTVKKQLKFDTPERVSRVASMEVTADGIVTQISQDEDPDILLGTTEPQMDKHTGSVVTASTATSSQPHQHGSVSTNGSQSQTPSRSPMAPKPKSSAIMFVSTKSQDKEHQGTLEQDEKSRTTREYNEADRSEKEHYESTPVAPKTDISQVEPGGQVAASVVSASSDDTPAAAEDADGGDPPRTSEALPPTRTISVEQDRLNLVSPLTLHPTTKEREQQHQEGGISIEDEIEEEEDTLEETGEDNTATGNTFDSNSRNDWTEHHDENNVLHKMDRKMQEVAKSLMGTFQCTPEQIQKIQKNPIQGAMSMFYDGLYESEEAEENPRRPYFNEDFARRFVNRMLTNGMSLLYLQPPQTTSNPSDDWKGRTVVMKIVPGSTGTQEAIQPKLQWTTMPGGTVTKSYMTSIPILRIYSVLTANQNLVPVDSTTADLDDNDLCFVSITSASGKVFLFEANSVRERDEIANGLRNVIARLTFHLVAGDQKASTELYNDDRAIQEETEPGDLPALASPRLNMNRMTHLLLES